MAATSPKLFTTRMRKAPPSISDALVNAKFAITPSDKTVRGGKLYVFYHIFAYLEDAKQRLNMPDFDKLFVDEVLYRKQAFEEDLRHYLGEEWRSSPKSLALENYLQHLQDLERDNPRLLMAYVYHLYLDLLSGGLILAKKRRVFETSEEMGYVDKFTDFSDTDISKLKKDFRDAMNSIAENMSEEEQEAFIEESNQVFLMNKLIVNSVGGQNNVICNILQKILAFIAIIIVLSVICIFQILKKIVIRKIKDIILPNI